MSIETRLAGAPTPPGDLLRGPEQILSTSICIFVFLQLRSALKAYGVPWSSSISSHPMRDWIAPSAGRPSVSLIYNKTIDCITKPLSIKTIWNRELSDLNLSVDWERVWSNLSLTSKNLAHRLNLAYT